MERLHGLFERYLQGQLSGEDYAEFWTLLAEPDAWESLTPGLRELWLESPVYGLPDSEWEQKMTTLLREQRLAKRGTLRVRILRYAAAAAVMLLLGGGWLYERLHRPAAAPGAAPAFGTVKPLRDVLPGGNRAVLTLAGGQTVVLDSAANGLLVQQGGTQVQKSNSRLEYVAPSASLKGAGGPGTTGGVGEVIFNTLATPRGGQYQLVLSDGTRVWLNAASSITYPTLFTGLSREVTVTGEAYFEIAKNATQPFVVHAAGSETEVLGTSFDIMAYAGEPAIRTTLVEGAVRFRHGPDAIVLHPSQQVRLTPAGRLKLVPQADVEQATAWKNGWQIFRQANLATIMREVGRWYNVDVDDRAGLPSDITFSGEIPRNVNLSDLLRVFERRDLHFSIDAARHRVTVTR